MRSRGPLEPDFSAVRGKRLLAALSGGADSAALVHLLAAAREACELTLAAAHVDHGIRPDSAGDAEFCRSLCARLGVPFYCVRVDVPAAARANRAGLETEARRLRLEQLERFRAQTESDYIVTAHHMDDQAETLLMHLGRGAGLDGLGAMHKFSGRFYRPLLGFRKAELVEYLRRSGFDWREDSTNRVDDNPRNAIRLHVIPELEKCYPRFVPAAARCARSAQIDADCLDGMARAFLARGGSAPGCDWLDLSDPPHRAILRRGIRRACPGSEALTWAQVDALEALCGDPRGKIDVNGECFAERAGRRLYFVRKRRPAIAPVPLDPGGITALSGICEISAREAPPRPVRDDAMTQVLDADALLGAVLRTRRDGDRFRPLGCGDRLLSDFLIDRKVDRPLRDDIALIARGDRVLWVCGLGISQDARITGETRAAVRLACRYTFDMSRSINK